MPFTIAIIIVPDRGLPVNRLKEFLQPAGDAAVIFVEHRRTDDSYDSAANSLANALTSLAPARKIRIVTEGMSLEKGMLYLLTAGTNMDMLEGKFVPAHPLPAGSDVYLPDFFLSRMAYAYRDRLVAILTDHAGMLGAQTVCEEGGVIYLVAGTGPASNALPATGSPLTPLTLLAPGQFVRRLTTNRSAENSHIPYSSKKIFSLCDPGFSQWLERDIIPLMWKGRKQHGPLRIWVAGASSPEIGYSVALALFDHLSRHTPDIRTRIFVSQLNRRRVEHARTGIFETAALTHVPPSHREHYFTQKDKDTWQIIRSIQQLCVFSAHHLLADPPFSHCDLIVCGEALRLLSEPDSNKLMRNLHYALNPHGLLFLPPNFTGSEKRLVLFDAVSNIPGLYTRADDQEPVHVPAPSTRPPSEAEREADKILMTGYVPAAMLVNEQLRVIRFYGIMSPFLRRQMDRPTLHLLNLVRDELIFELSDLLEKVDTTRQPATRDNICLSGEEGPEYRLEVIPINHGDRKNKLVIFRERTSAPAYHNDDPDAAPRDQRVKALERQIQKLRYQLQTAHRMFKQTQEDLQQANEEIVRYNEELLCMNEELLSINDDLHSRNLELETRIKPVPSPAKSTPSPTSAALTSTPSLTSAPPPRSSTVSFPPAAGPYYPRSLPISSPACPAPC
ncbi:MAG TPA: CheR family methyltransferase [Puia sp.]|nr:CheR family methyltransferase [Puia sp.]